ncbi:MAG: hypothetical protein ACO3N7_04005 [Kiritimatiellia bacterium]
MILALLTLSGLFSGCASQPVPTGDRLVSVSWVNLTPNGFKQIETRLNDSRTPVKMGNLPPYAEHFVNTDQPLFRQMQVQMLVLSGSRSLRLDPGFVEAPVRKSGEGAYNLRIQIVADGTAKALLEPVELSRIRRGKSSGGTPPPQSSI